MATEWKEPMGWDNTGTAPSDNLKAAGFKAGDKPPAAIFNYFLNKTAECINQLQEETDNVNTNKVDKVSGKGLSTNDYTTTEKNKLSGIETGANKTVIDTALSSSSTNPVQNKVVNTALGNKVDKVSGKGLSTNDYTTDEKTKLAGIATGANKTTVDSSLSTSSTNPVQNKVINTALGTKVDKVDGKGLSTNDYTTTEKNKLAGIAEGANKTTVDSALSETSTNPVQNKVINSALAGKAASSHSHGAATTSAAGFMSATDKSKLDGIATGATKYTHPTTHPASMITGLATVATSGSYNDLANKPTIPTIPASLPANGGNADTVDNKHASDFAAANHTHDYAASSHTHAQSDITGLSTSLGNKVDKVSGKGLSTNDFTAAYKTKLDGIATGATKVTVDSELSSSSTNPVQNSVINAALAGKAASSHTHNYAGSASAGGAAHSANSMGAVTASSTDGVAYTATVDGVTSLYAGLKITIVPNKVSANKTPTLNLNGLGAKNIIMPIDGANTAMATNGASLANWLSVNAPCSLTYDGTRWKADVKAASASYLYGIVPIAHGGTGADNAEEALEFLGAAPAYNYGTADLTAGSSALETGKLYFVYE